MSHEEALSSSSLTKPYQNIDSDNSEEFQVLKSNQNEQQDEPRCTQQQNNTPAYGQIKEMQSAYGQSSVFQEQPLKIRVQLQQQTAQIETLKKQNRQLSQLYQNFRREIKVANLQLSQIKTENSALKEQNTQLRQALDILKEQSHQYIDKISCLQQKSQLEKELFDNKFTLIRKNLEKVIKKSTKNMDQQSTLNLLVATFESVEKIMEKINEAYDLIIDNKKDKNRLQNQSQMTDILSQKYSKVEKIQSVMIKQQTKINSLKEQVKKLEEGVKEAQGNSGGLSLGISKWLDPVMKFCKIQEGKVTENREKKTKNNS